MKPLILQGPLNKEHFYRLEDYLLEAFICSEELIVILINTYFGDAEYIRSFEKLKKEIDRPISMVGIGNIENPIFFLGDNRYAMPNSNLFAVHVEEFEDIFSSHSIFENGQVEVDAIITENWEVIMKKLLGIYGQLKKKTPYYKFIGDFDERNTANFFEYSFYRAAMNKPAIVLIDSPGGQMQNLWVMLELVSTLNMTLITLGYGIVASAASLFLMMSDERYLAPGCEFMIHGSRVKKSEESTLQELGLSEAEAVENANYYVFIYATAKTQMTKKLILKETNNFSNDWFVPDERWLNCGIITGSLAEGIRKIKNQI